MEIHFVDDVEEAQRDPSFRTNRCVMNVVCVEQN